MWKQQGTVSLWRYTVSERIFPGWHLNADPVGCASLLGLVSVLVQAPGDYRTVQISAPSPTQLAVPNNHGGRAAWVAPTKLRLSFLDDAAAWIFPPDLEPAALKFGSDWIDALRKGIAGIPDGEGDYSIGGNKKQGSLGLWFWW